VVFAGMDRVGGWQKWPPWSRAPIKSCEDMYDYPRPWGGAPHWPLWDERAPVLTLQTLGMRIPVRLLECKLSLSAETVQRWTRAQAQHAHLLERVKESNPWVSGCAALIVECMADYGSYHIRAIERGEVCFLPHQFRIDGRFSLQGSQLYLGEVDLSNYIRFDLADLALQRDERVMTPERRALYATAVRQSLAASFPKDLAALVVDYCFRHNRHLVPDDEERVRTLPWPHDFVTQRHEHPFLMRYWQPARRYPSWAPIALSKATHSEYSSNLPDNAMLSDVLSIQPREPP
jgi:hypothetical protein